jgi:hypothetical protein
VREALRTEASRAFGQLVDLAARDGRQPRGDDGLDPSTGGERRVEHAEARRRRAGVVDQGRTHVDELHPEPDVGLVAAEALRSPRRT